MKKIGMVFSGQGAQYIGMGKELYEQFDVCKHIFEEAEEATKVQLKKLCVEGSESELNRTENTQPAVVTVSLAALAALKEYGITPDIAAGLSLGEYSALTAAGVFDVKTVTALVKKRGKYMQEAVPEGMGAMAAILGMKEQQVKELCEEVKEIGYVEPANYNCPGQIVIGGEKEAVQAAVRLVKERGTGKAVLLPVSAPFHTKLLVSAAEKLAAELETISFGVCQIPVIENRNGEYITEDSDLKDILKRQVMTPVQWEKSVRRMLEDGVDCIIEAGPGKVLCGFIKKIDRKIPICHVEDKESLKQTVELVSALNKKE